MRALVTGGAGFIGSHVAQHLVAGGHQVVVLDDLSGGFRGNVPAGAQFIEGSVTDASLVDRLFDEHRFELVYHIAAYAAEGLSHFIRRFNYQNNIVGSAVLINASIRHDVKCFVFTSSIAVYGAGQVPMTEDMVPRPEDPYGIAKYAVELDLRAAHEQFGLNYVIVRPHNVYGERQNIADRYRNVIGIFMGQIMRGEALTIFGDGGQTRAFSYIDDVAPHIAAAPANCAALGETINLGADVPYSVLELAKAVSDAFDVPLRVTHLPARNEVVHAISSHDRARRIFGEARQVSLRDGLARMATWARREGIPQATRTPEIELRQSLPAGWG
jgi:UDP-glucose 4-epimerase